MAVTYLYDDNTEQWVPAFVGARGPSGVVVGPTPPTDTTVAWVDTSSESFQVDLNSLSDVAVEGAADGEFLIYDSVTNLFVNSPAFLNNLADVDEGSGFEDGDVLIYDATFDVWVPGEPAAGGLVAVKSALKTNAQSFTNVGAGDNRTPSGLTITHALANASNRLIISAFLGAANNNSNDGQVGIAVHDGTGLIAIGTADGNRTQISAGSRHGSGASNQYTNPAITFVHTPGAGSKTYTVHAINITAVTGTVFINRTPDDSNIIDRPRAVSSLVIQEVKV